MKNTLTKVIRIAWENDGLEEVDVFKHLYEFRKYGITPKNYNLEIYPRISRNTDCKVYKFTEKDRPKDLIP